jgi:RNA polymerase sigma-70 factor, ECF subfamily
VSLVEEAAGVFARARPELVPLDPALVRALDDAIAGARAAWPSVSVPLDAFVTRLAEAARAPSPQETCALLTGLKHADLYLACGCLAALPAALRIFEDQFLARVPRFVAHLDRSAAFAEDVRQELSRKLLLGDPPTAPSLARYAGRGPLDGFIAVAAQRMALDLLRKQGRLELPGDDAELERHLGSTSDPELEAIKARLRGEFAEALRNAIGALDRRERMTLRLTLISGLSLEEIGAIYGVNASTICRWLGKTRDRLALELRRQLSARRQIQAGELESIVRLVQSGLDLGLSALLARSSQTNGGGPPERGTAAALENTQLPKP